MQVYLGKAFVGMNDEVILDQSGKPFTLLDAVKIALTAQMEEEKNLSGEDKMKRYEIYMKVKQATDPAELEIDEVALIKKLIGKVYGVVDMGKMDKQE